MNAHVDPAAISHTIDVVRAEIAALDAMTSTIEADLGRLGFSAHTIAAFRTLRAETTGVARTSHVMPAQPPPQRTNSNTERSDARRAALRAMGLPVKTRGRIEDLRVQHGCNEVQRRCNVAPVAPPCLRSESQQNDDDEGEARARETVVPFPAPDVERIATAVESMVRDGGHWPRGGWPHAVTVAAITAHLAAGISPAVILDAVRTATQRAPAAPIHTIRYFAPAIARAHRDATAPQLALPLPPPSTTGDIHARRHDLAGPHHRPAGGSPAQAARRRVEQLIAAGVL